MELFRLFIEITLTFILVAFITRYTILEKRYSESIEQYSKLLSQKKSSEVRLGQISENLAPFLKEFKYDPKKCHFLGNPIDYVVFEDDKIVFLEVKSGESKLSTSQKNIKELINSKQVYFDQMQIK